MPTSPRSLASDLSPPVAASAILVAAGHFLVAVGHFLVAAGPLVVAALLVTSHVAVAAPAAGAATTTKATDDPAREAAARMQKFYESTTDLHARFEQEVSSGLGGKKTASGEVWLKKPGRMMWDYEKPEKKLMIADGHTLWVYEPEDEQAFQQSLKSSTLPSSVTFLFGTGKLAEEFSLSIDKTPGLGGEGDVVLKLIPNRATAQYRYLDFVLDGKSYMVKESYVYDQQGGVNHLRFVDVVTNKGLTDDKFVFTPPPGTQILRP